MRILLYAASIVAALSFGPSPAFAAPRAVAPEIGPAPQSTPVSGGCTIGFHPGPFGYCLQDGSVGVDVFGRSAVAPAIVEPNAAALTTSQVCPPSYRLSPSGFACRAD